MQIDKDFIAEVQETIKNGVEIGTVFFTPLEHRQIETAFKQLTDAVKKLENENEELKEQIDFFERHLHMMPQATYEASEKRIKELEQDNRDLIEQNKLMFDTSMANDHEFGLSYKYAKEIANLKEQVKLLNTALDIAAEDIDFDVLGTCPNEFEDYGCPFGECKFADGKPHNNDCWKKAFIKAAEKHLRGEK